MITLTTLQLDALTEIGNIGAAHAISGLAVLLKTRVELSVPKVQLLPLQAIPEFLGGAEIMVSAVYLEINGEIDGGVVMIFPKQNALNLITMIEQKEKSETKEFTEYEESILKEVANICAASYLGVIAKMTHCKISCSVPLLAVDMLGSILEQVLAVVAKDIDHALIIETDFVVKEYSVNGYFLVLPKLAGLTKMIEKLEM